MLRGYVLRYLALLSTGASIPEARARLPQPLSPLVMTAGQKRMITAGFATQHGGDGAHLARLAYLAVLGATVADDDDIDAVRAAFEASRRPASEARAGRRLALGVLGLVVLAAVGITVVVVARRPDPQPLVVTATSGDAGANLEEILGMNEPPAPVHSLDAVFGELLPDVVIALDRRGAGAERSPPDDVESTRARVIEALEGEGDAGGALAAPLDALIAESVHYVDRDDGHDDTTWLNQLVLVHDALHAADVPYYVDATLLEGRGGRRVLLSTWNVEQRRLFRVDEQEIRALDITRRDSLNFERSLLGYTRPEMRHALVVVDRIERFLVEDVLPSVNAAADSVIVRDYADETGTEWVTTFEEHAHEDLRREAERVVRAEMGNARALDTLAGAVVQRRNAVAIVSGSLTNVDLREPWRYDYDVSRLEFRGDVDRAGLRSLREAEAILHTEDVLRAYRLLLEARAENVAEHEVQHRLDYMSDRLATIPEALSRYTGETALDAQNLRAERANAELSAYLSQIAQNPDLAFTSLVHVASFMMSRPSWAMPEAYAAVALFESMATEAGIAHVPLIANRRIDRGEAARIYAALHEAGPEALSSLARRTWQTLYGSELAEIRRAD
jgi:hypothetical protein